MPLVAFALAAYLSGLLAGFSGSFGLVLVMLAGAWLIGSTYTRRATIGLAALVVAGAAVARTSSGDEASCATAPMRRMPVLLALTDSAAPGSLVAAQVPHCEARVSIGVQVGVSPAGATVSAIGDAIQSQRGWLLQHAEIHVVAPPPPLDWRALSP